MEKALSSGKNIQLEAGLCMSKASMCLLTLQACVCWNCLHVSIDMGGLGCWRFAAGACNLWGLCKGRAGRLWARKQGTRLSQPGRCWALWFFAPRLRRPGRPYDGGGGLPQAAVGGRGKASRFLSRLRQWNMSSQRRRRSGSATCVRKDFFHTCRSSERLFLHWASKIGVPLTQSDHSLVFRSQFIYCQIRKFEYVQSTEAFSLVHVLH